MVSVTLYICLRFAAQMLHRLGDNGTAVFMRLSAFIMLCLGVQIFWEGARELMVGVLQQVMQPIPVPKVRVRPRAGEPRPARITKFIETMTSRPNACYAWSPLFCFGAVGIALISQHAFDMPPCAWCVMQRLIYLVIGVVALVGGFGGGRA